MSLNNIKDLKSEKGFTIVELLIVIVVIGILAAIVIVAYNGVQNRAKLSSAQATANALVKKAEAYNAQAGSYPTTLTGTTGFDNYNESKVTSSGIGLVATPVAGTGTNTVTYKTCTAGGTGVGGAVIQYYDYVAGAVSVAASNQYMGVLNSSNFAACTTFSTAPTLTAGN